MASSRAEIFTIQNAGSSHDFEFFLNSKGDIFAQQIGETGYESFLVITKDDWVELKKFIDEQFGNNPKE